MLPSLPKLDELDSRGRRVLLRALAGASRRTRAHNSGNHPDHIGDDALAKARCSLCQADREGHLRDKHGEDADEKIQRSRQVSANLAFLHKCVEVLERRRAADARDATIEEALKTWPTAIKLVAERTGYSIAAVNRVAKRMRDGDLTGPQHRATLEKDHLDDLRRYQERQARRDTRAEAYDLFEAGLTTGEIAKALGVTSGRISQLRKCWAGKEG